MCTQKLPYVQSYTSVEIITITSVVYWDEILLLTHNKQNVRSRPGTSPYYGCKLKYTFITSVIIILIARAIGRKS